MGLCFSRGRFAAVKAQNVACMGPETGYDVTIVCTGDSFQAAFWTKRLAEGKGTVVKSDAVVIAVDEDWNGGAGNFLGTLYAWRKACDALKKQSFDLPAALADGKSVAIFHTAGKGTRLAPLPGAENNNKPGVRLPTPGGVSILESVIRQTGAYASSRAGRLSVFWSDQLFVPSLPTTYEPQHHADILCGLGPMPDADEWQRRGLQAYGLIAATTENTVVAQLDKVSHSEAQERLSKFDNVDRVGASLGSFSLSASFLAALTTGFEKELRAKRGTMDSDPHIWMAMTLDVDAYAKMMVTKKFFDENGARLHHARIQQIISSFDKGSLGLFGAVDAGECSWWDFGQLKLYRHNSLLLTQEGEDAIVARAFFGVDETNRVSDSNLGDCQADQASVISGSRCCAGSISRSTLCDVSAKHVEAEDAVLVQVSVRKIVAGKGAIAYNIVDDSEDGIVLGENEVRVGVFTLNSSYFQMNSTSSYFQMTSNVEATDGGKVWKERVHGNAKSFEEVYLMNQGADVAQCASKAIEAHKQCRDLLFADTNNVVLE